MIAAQSTNAIACMSDQRRRAESALIYHLVHNDESFDDCTEKLLLLTRHAAESQPGRRRVLFLDIEGHRNANGGFDAEMYGLQRDFVIGWLMPYLSEAHMPLGNFRNDEQRDDIPPGDVVFEDLDLK